MLKILKQIFARIALIYGRHFIWTICLILGAVLLLFILALPDAFFMSDKALLENLSNRYAREFTVISSHSFSEAERAEDVWRLKVYELAPVNEPEEHFWVYNIIRGESGGIFGFANGLQDTRDAQILLAAFAGRAAQADLNYEPQYYNNLCRSAGEYYSDIGVKIDVAGIDDLPAVCEIIVLAVEDAAAQLPPAYNYAVNLDFVLIYREPEWPEDKFYPLRLTSFDYWSAKSAADIQEKIISNLDWYRENYDVWKKLNK